MTTSRDIRDLVGKKIAEEALKRFMSKSTEYGDDVFQFGVEVQAIDMVRKMGKIKGAMWDGRKLEHETLPELLHDMIGHCYITLARLELEGFSTEGPDTPSEEPEYVGRGDPDGQA